MSSPSPEMLHATAVAINGCAVLIRGPSGSGKSDLALRLIDRGAGLISDDYTVLTRKGAYLHASAAPNIAGKIEVRGVGVVELPYVEDIPVRLVVSLGDVVERMPPEARFEMIAGVRISAIVLSGLEPSAPLKVELQLDEILTAGER